MMHVYVDFLAAATVRVAKSIFKDDFKVVLELFQSK